METGVSPDKQLLSVDVIVEGKPNTLKKTVTTSSKQQQIRCFCHAFDLVKPIFVLSHVVFVTFRKKLPITLFLLKNSTVKGFHMACTVFNSRR